MTAMAQRETENFRANVAELCDEPGDIQRIANLAGITRVYLSNVIHGKTVPSMDMASRIAEALQVSLRDLLQNPRDFKFAKVS